MNRTILLFSLTVLGIFSTGTLLAQKTETYTNQLNVFENAKMLYIKKQFVPSIQLFEECIARNKHPNLNFECALYIALSRIKLDKKYAQIELAKLIRTQPDHHLSDEIYLELALHYFDKENFNRSKAYFDKINILDLPKERRDEFTFKKGYALFKNNEYMKAKHEFIKLMNSDGPYYIEANYYYGYQCYILKDFDCAMVTFTKIGDKGPKTMQLYLAQMHYENEDYEKAFTIVKNLKLSKQQNEIELLIGKIQYQLGHKNIALNHFEKYKGNILKLSSDELYQFADVYYLNKEFKKALPFYILLANEETELGQTSNYHIGLIDVKNDQKERAINAFSEARRKNFNPEISEIAAYNYAKLSAELKQNNTAINAINSFIVTYPKSSYINEVKSLLADVFLTTKNYKSAIEILENIPTLDSRSKEVYQELTFHRAEELYLNHEYEMADAYFSKSLIYPIKNTLESESYFWKAEIAAKRNDYDASINLMNRYMSLNQDQVYKNYGYYSLGYSYFKKKDYAKAQNYFEKYLDYESFSTKNRLTYLNNKHHLADCYFINGLYKKAIETYDFVIQNDYKNSDYALYQQGMVYGLQEKHLDKISVLRKIQKDFNKSIFIDDALFQMGMEHLAIEDYSTADKLFNLIISQHDYSPFLPVSYLKMGLINYNQNNDEVALRYYKTVVERFPKTKASKEALSFVEIIYNNQGKPQDYFDYVKEIPGASVSINLQDSTIYQNAMNFYTEENFKRASKELDNYIKRFGDDGFFIIAANYYKAECDFYTGDKIQALNHYDYVAKQSTNPYQEKSIIKLTNHYFKEKQYPQALDYYRRLEPIAASKSTYLNAILGQMRCYDALSDFSQAKAKAIQLLPIENVPTDNLVEANMLLGKIQRLDSNFKSAKFHYDYVIAESRNEMTAEALYHRASYSFKQKDMDASRTDIITLNDDFSAYEYWVVKGFILLSDIYLFEDDLFQAKATLQSILDNYFNKEDGLLDTCHEKIQAIHELEDKKSLLEIENITE